MNEDPHELQEKANMIKSYSAYNSAVIKCHTNPSTASLVINEKLLTDSYLGYIPETHSSCFTEFSAISSALDAIQNFKFLQVNLTEIQESHKPTVLMKEAIETMYRFGKLTWDDIIIPSYYNNFGVIMYLNANINNLNVQEIYDKEIFIMKSGVIQSENMQEISIDQCVNNNFILIPIIKILCDKFEIEFHRQDSLGQITNELVYENGEDNLEFWSTMNPEFITMTSNLAYFLFQSNKKEHRDIGLKFLNISNILCEKIPYDKAKYPVLQTFVKFLYAIYFIDIGEVKSSEKLINEIVANEQLDYKCDSLKLFALEILASGMRVNNEINYYEILRDKAKKLEKERNISQIAFENNLFLFNELLYVS